MKVMDRRDVPKLLASILAGQYRCNGNTVTSLTNADQAITIEMLAQLAKQALDQKPAVAFGTTHVPITAVIRLGVSKLAMVPGPVQSRIGIVVHFRADDELDPDHPNPVMMTLEPGDGVTADGDVRATWRDREPAKDAAAATEQLARSYGWNPEGAAALGLTEKTLPAWFRDLLGGGR